MEIGSYCAYNVSLDVLLSEHVREVSEQFEPLQVLALLLNGPGIDRQSAVWMRHCTGARQWPRLFAFDVAYLDADQRIVEAAAVGPGTDFPPVPENVMSVLFLSDGRLSETGSTRGNVIRICTKAELAAEIEPASFSSSGPREAQMQAQPLQNEPDPSPSFDVTGLREFSFDPFVGSLVYLPDPVRPIPQTTEYFLTREVIEKPFSALVQELRQMQKAEAGIAEPVLTESNHTEESALSEEAGVQPDTQLPPELKPTIQLIRDQARRETEIQKESRKKKARTPRKRRTTQVEEPAIEAEQATAPSGPQSVLNLQPLVPAPESRELPITAQLSEEVPPVLNGVQAPGILPESALIGHEEAIAPSMEQKIEEEPLTPALEAVTEPVTREPALIAEPMPEITTPETAHRPAREKQDRLSLGRRLQHLLMGTMAAPRRRSPRVAMPGLVAFYWSGGAPQPHEIVNISKSGFYLRTKDLWLPDTLVRMTLERPRGTRGEKKQSIGVLARVVRIDEDGVGHEFVTTEDLRRIRTRHILPKQGTSKKDLDAFLNMH